MSSVTDSINNFLIKHQRKWYFFPAAGMIFLVLTNVSVFAFMSLSKSSSHPQPEATPTPIPTQPPTPSPEPEAEEELDDDPEETPRPSVKPSPTPKPSPTTTPKPTPTPVSKEDVRIIKPEHQKNYDSKDIEIEMEVVTSRTVKKLEFILNGQVKKTFESSPYKATLSLDSDSYELQGKAYFENDESITSGTLKFGAGGTSWDAPDPTPSPTPSPSPTPEPS